MVETFPAGAISSAGPGGLFLDTIPEDKSVAAARVANLSTASAVASSEGGGDGARDGDKRNNNNNKKEGPQSDAGVSDTPALLGEGQADAGGIAPTSKAKVCTRKTTVYCGVLSFLTIAVAIGIYFVVEAVTSNSSSDGSSRAVTASPLDELTFPPFEVAIQSESPTVAPSMNLLDIADIDQALLQVSIPPSSLLPDDYPIYDPSTPQGKCRYWMTRQDAAELRVAVDGESRVQQRYILCVLYFATDGQNWVDLSDAGEMESSIVDTDSISFLDGSLHECDWFGISCDKDQVAVIALPFMNLSGELPNELIYLTGLQGLSLYSNSLSGSIPSGIWNLPQLVWCDMARNQLTGSIPGGSATRLQILYLYQNELEGFLPYFPNLQKLWAQQNLFTGVDERYASSSTLVSWLLYDNVLGGALPSTWNVPNLKDFDMAMNQWTGDFPLGLWVNAPKLETLILHDTLLSGSLPIVAASSPSMKHVWLQNNQLVGDIPVKFGWDWSNLVSLLLHNNDLEGTIDDLLCAQWDSIQRLSADCDTTTVVCACCTECYGRRQRRADEESALELHRLSSATVRSHGYLRPCRT